MANIYYGTMLNPDLAKATIRLYIYDGNKYETPDEGRKIEVTGVKSWTVVRDDEAKYVEALGVEEDEYHEYLVLNYADGRTEIYPNTKVAMFVL